MRRGSRLGKAISSDAEIPSRADLNSLCDGLWGREYG
jgi:hypothetical protein